MRAYLAHSPNIRQVCIIRYYTFHIWETVAKSEANKVDRWRAGENLAAAAREPERASDRAKQTGKIQEQQQQQPVGVGQSDNWAFAFASAFALPFHCAQF